MAVGPHQVSDFRPHGGVCRDGPGPTPSALSRVLTPFRAALRSGEVALRMEGWKNQGRCALAGPHAFSHRPTASTTQTQEGLGEGADSRKPGIPPPIGSQGQGPAPPRPRPAAGRRGAQTKAPGGPCPTRGGEWKGGSSDAFPRCGDSGVPRPS